MPKATYQKRGSSTVDMDGLFASTLDYRKDDIVDQIFVKKPALAYMLERKQTQCINDAEQFLIPMEHERNPNGGMIDEEEGISMDDFDPDTMAIYSAKTAAYGVRFGRKQKRVNAGKSKIYSLIDHKIKNTQKSLRDTLSSQLWTGSGTGKQANGLTRLIPATAKASQSVSIGGLSPSTYAWWRTQATNMANMAAATYLEEEMLSMYNIIEDETGAPDVIFCDRATQEIYENNAKEFVRVDARKIANVTFTMTHYKDMPIIRDKEAPVGELRMITNDQISFEVDPDYWFEWTGWKEIPNLPFTTVKQVVCVFQMCRSAARGLGCIYNISVDGS